MAIVAKPDGPKSAADLKGKKVSVSTAGSLTYWLVSETSSRQGWGPNGIEIQPMGAMPGQIAALKRGDIDGIIMDIGNALDLEKRGEGRILVRFTDIKDFHIHVIFATDKVIAEKPDNVRAFLKGWFETIAFMRKNKAETVKIAAEVTNKSEAITAASYDELMPMFSDTGRFDPKALETLRHSYVELKLLPTEPTCRSSTPKRSCRNEAWHEIAPRCAGPCDFARRLRACRRRDQAPRRQGAAQPVRLRADRHRHRHRHLQEARPRRRDQRLRRRRQDDAGADRRRHRHRARRRPGVRHHRQGRADEGGGRARQRAEHHHAGGQQGRPDQDRGRPQGQDRQRLHHRLADLLADHAIVARPGLGHRRHQDHAARRRPGPDRRAPTNQIEGVTTDSVTCYQFVEAGGGRILVKFGDSVKDFHVHVIYASDKLIESNPEGLKAFLAGWFETIRFMRDHKDQAIEIAAKRTGVSKAVATEGYNDTMPIFSTTGHFEPKALDVLATSFVDTKLLPEKPDMSKLLTEAYLPK